MNLFASRGNLHLEWGLPRQALEHIEALKLIAEHLINRIDELLRRTTPRYSRLCGQQLGLGNRHRLADGAEPLKSQLETLAVMSTQEIAARLATLVAKGEFDVAQRELFAEDAVSVEQQASEHFQKETKGLQAILKKGEKWAAMVEKVHSCSTSEPLAAGDAIAMALVMDLTISGRGRMQLAEICVYEVKNGKIVSERFFA